ncbi:MAG TPA: hypothetical protein P5060_00140 [Candidatus Absconditabacterales bacterium]|nr:hypothetical protein [Candidatus Absconditabacterales bacterium]
MKKIKIIILVLFFSVTASLLSSCKKDETLQPSWQWLLKETVIFENTAEEFALILDHIDAARTTTDTYVWCGDTITLNGPAGYEPLSEKSAVEIIWSYRNEIMADTTQFLQDGVLSKVIQKYLEIRRHNSAEDAYYKMRLAIPADLYELYPRFWERVLTEIMSYLTTQIGGNSDWYGGTRDIGMEKNIYKLPWAPDIDYQDPWGCNCAAYYYFKDFFKDRSEGDNKKSTIIDVEMVQKISSRERFIKLGFDCETSYNKETNNYVVEFPVI